MDVKKFGEHSKIVNLLPLPWLTYVIRVNQFQQVLFQLN